ncbi:MAG TPA: hypothetical protein VGB73_12620 [Pyrinomonadaceae bacterium]|jgi:hypothetical protein
MYAIVVSITQPENVCFIVTPFSEQFQGVSNLIQQAANRHGLQSVRTDDIQGAVNFPEDILRRTQAARMIVAVCSPEPETGKPNPNVMYELGLAQSIGKPTLILTTDVATLPADIDTQYALKYTEQEVQQKNFLVLRITNEIGTRLGRMRDPLTDSSYHQKGISVAQARHRLLVYPEFWEHYKNILAYAKHIHQQFQTVETGHTSILRRQVDETISSLNVGMREVAAFNKAWENYIRAFQTTQEFVYENMEDKKARLEASFDYLSQHAEGAKAYVERCKGFYQLVTDRIETHLAVHNRIKNKYNGNFIELREPNSAINIYNLIQELAGNTQDLLIQADGLMRNLIDLIVE